MEVCKRHLSKNGLAIVSYNALPGWNSVKSLRDMMLYHTQNFTTPEEQLRESKNLLSFLHDNTGDSNEGYKSILENEKKKIELNMRRSRTGTAMRREDLTTTPTI